jgi:hypothetical protein
MLLNYAYSFSQLISICQRVASKPNPFPLTPLTEVPGLEEEIEQIFSIDLNAFEPFLPHTGDQLDRMRVLWKQPGCNLQTIQQSLGELSRRLEDELKRFKFFMSHSRSSDFMRWPAPGSEDTELGVFMGPEASHGKTKVYAGVQA